MDPNGKSVNPPIIGGVPKQTEGMRNEKVAPAENVQQQTVVQGSDNNEGVKTVVTVLLLIFVYPIGVIVSWFLPKWKLWVKLLVSLPLVLGFVMIALGVALLAMNPSAQLKKAQFISECTKTYTQQECAQKYIQMQLAEPSITLPSIK
jgi:hypothetical protein